MNVWKVLALSVVVFPLIAGVARSQNVISYSCIPATCAVADPGPLRNGVASVTMSGICQNGQRPTPASSVTAACKVFSVSLDADGYAYNPPPSCPKTPGSLNTSATTWLYPHMSEKLAWGYFDWSCNGDKSIYSSPPAQC